MNDATNKTEDPKAEQDSEKESEGQEITEDLASALEQEKERADRNLANWQRAQADLSNYKKRVDQEKQDLAKFANAALIGSMLNLVDDFQRARSTIPESILGMTWVEGLFLIERKLGATLEAAGLSEIKALGEDFDPNLHEAVMHGDGPEGKIVEEFQRGYKLHDRVIRPAMVKVGQGEAEEEAASGEGQQGSA
jgi:molecular chaperone GrpE